MKVALINGSPKAKNSASAAVVEALWARIGSAADRAVCSVVKQSRSEILDAFGGCDTLVFIFPLYVDGIPSHLLRLLDEVRGEIVAAAPRARIYAVINNGFFEGRQNAIALEMMRNFATCAGLEWGQGIGIGGGGMIRSVPIGRGPMRSIGKALDLLAENILSDKTADDHTVEPDFPRFLYKAAAHLEWWQQSKRNGLKRIPRKPIKTS